MEFFSFSSRSWRTVWRFPSAFFFPHHLPWESSHRLGKYPRLYQSRKKYSKSLVSNYRPVAFCSASKIMEAINTDTLRCYMLEEKLISDAQHGFLPRRSTVTQLLTCMEQWTTSVENNRAIDAVYRDLYLRPLTLSRIQNFFKKLRVMVSPVVCIRGSKMTF